MANQNPIRPIPDAPGSVGDISLESAHRLLSNLVDPSAFENVLDETLPPLVRSFSQCPKGVGAQSLSNVISAILSIPPGSGTNLFGSSGPILRVTPVSDFLVSGIEGSDFGGPTATYTVRNDGGDPLPWTATVQNASSWISLSDSSGVLQVGESQVITITLDDATLTGFPIGSFSDNVLFVNTVDGVGDTVRLVLVAVSDSATTPPSGLSYPSLLTSYIVQLDIGEHFPSVTGSVDFYSVSPTLPDGIEIESIGGRVYGFPSTPTAPDTYRFTATNAVGQADIDLVLGVANPPSESPPESLRYSPNPLVLPVGVDITTILPIITGGIPNSYVAAPEFPSGVNLHPTAGFISGLPIATSLPQIHTIVASNSGGPVQFDLSLEISGAPVDTVTYAPSTFVLTVGTPITSVTPTTTGGAPDLFSVSPDLNALTGLSINPGTGAISGTPTLPLDTSAFVVEAGNAFGFATATLTFTVNPDSPDGLQYTPNPALLTAGVPAIIQPSDSGGPILSYTASPALPASLSLDAGTGIITGTPDTESPAFVHTMTGTNVSGSTTVGLSITVRPSPPSNPLYTPRVFKVTIADAITPVTPTLDSGTSVTWAVDPPLPSGFNISPANGRISGTATVGTTQDPDTYTVTASNVTLSATTTISLEIDPRIPGALSYSPNPLDVFIGQSVLLSPMISPGDNLQYSADSLPLGLSISPDTGVISGAPTTEDENDNPVSPQYPVSDYNLIENTFLSNQVPVLVSGTADLWSITPSLPTGLVFSTSDGVFGGTPNTTSLDTEYTVIATNQELGTSDSTIISVQVFADTSSGDSPMAPSYPKSDYNLQVGSIVLPQTPQLASGIADLWSPDTTFPDGLVFIPGSGAFSGTPTSPTADATYTVTATNTGLGVSDTVAITISVVSPPPPLGGGDAVAEFTINTGVTNWFPARATLPLPTGYTYDRDKCPFTLYDPLQTNGSGLSPMDTQWEAASYYPNGDVATVEVIGRAYRGDNRYPGGSTQTFTLGLISPMVTGSPDAHFKIDRLLASPGGTYVVSFDVYGNEYRADIIPSPSLLEEIKLGPAWRTTHYHAPLRPVAPNGTTRGHMGGMHVYLSTTPNVVAAGLDLVWHNGMVGSPSSPSEEVEWDMFYEKLQLVLPTALDDWRIGTTRPEPFMSAVTAVGDTNVYDLIRPMADGTIHVMGHTRLREFRLSVHLDGLSGQGNLFTEYRGWGTVNETTFPDLRRGWSWYNGDCAGWGPTRNRLPSLTHLSGLSGKWLGYRDEANNAITNMADVLSGTQQTQVAMSGRFYEISSITKVAVGATILDEFGTPFSFPLGGVSMVLVEDNGSFDALTDLPAHWRAGKVPFIDVQTTSAALTTKLQPGGSLEWLQNILDDNTSVTLITVDGVDTVYVAWKAAFGDITLGDSSVTLIKTGTPSDNWDLRLPFANPDGIEWPYYTAGGAYGGQTGGTGIDSFFGSDGIWLGERTTIENVNTLAAAYGQRQRGFMYREMGSPMRIEDYAPSGLLPWSMAAQPGIYNKNNGTGNQYLLFKDLPFGFFSLSDKSHEAEVESQRRSPCYHLTFTKLNFDPIVGPAGGYDPIDFQHIIRATRTMEWSAWMANDPISKLTLGSQAETARMWSNERVGEGLYQAGIYTPANVGAQTIGRADGWNWRMTASNYALRSPASGRSNWSPFFKATLDALDRVRTPNGGWSVFYTGKVINNLTFEGGHAVGQQIEHCYLMNGTLSIAQSVFEGVGALAPFEDRSIYNIAQGGDNLWNFQWKWFSPTDSRYPGHADRRPWTYTAWRDFSPGVPSPGGTLIHTHADHPVEQYGISVDHFPTPVGMGAWQDYSPDNSDLDSALRAYSSPQDPLTYFTNNASFIELPNYAGIIGTLQEELYSLGGSGFNSNASTEYTIRATNEAGESTTGQTINVSDGAPATLTYAPDPAKGIAGSPLIITPIVTGGFPDIWSVSPSPFAGLDFNTVTGLFSGVVTTAQADTLFQIDASNDFGSVIGTVQIEILSSPISPPTNFRYSPVEVKTLIRDVGPVLVTPSYDGDLPFTSTLVTLTPALLNLSPSPPVGVITTPYDIANGELVFPITTGAPIPYHPPEKNTTHPNEVLHVYLPRGTAPASGWPTIFVNGSGVYLGFPPPEFLNPNLATDRTIIKALNAKYAVVYFGTASSGLGEETGFFKSPNTSEWLDWDYHMPEKGPVMAIQWSKLNAATYGLDPKWFYTLGVSSGSNINAYAVLGPDRAFATGSLQARTSTRVAGVVNLEGICTFTAYDSPFSAGMNHFESVSNPGQPASDIGDADPADLAAVSFASLIAHPSSNAPFTPVISLYDEAIGSTDYGQLDLTGFPGLSGTLLADVHDTWNGAMIHTMLRQADSPLHAAKSEFWHKSPIGALGDASPLVTGTFLEGVLASPAGENVIAWLTARLSGTAPDPDGLRIVPTSGSIFGTALVLDPISTRSVDVSTAAGFTQASLVLQVLIPSPSDLSYPDPNPVWLVNQPISEQSPEFTAEGVLSFTVNPPLPAGVNVSSFSGRLSGTPTEIETGVQHTIRLANTTGFTEAVLTVTVEDVPPVILRYSPNPGIFALDDALNMSPTSFGTVDSYSLDADVPVLHGYTFSTSTGVFSGTATPEGNFNYAVTASSQFGTSAPHPVSIVITDTGPEVLVPDSSFSYLPSESTAPNSFASANVWLPGTNAPTAGFPVILEFRADGYLDTSPRASISSFTESFLYTALINGVAVVSVGTTGVNATYSGGGVYHSETDGTYGEDFDAYWSERAALWAVQGLKGQIASGLNLDATRIYVDGDQQGGELALNVALGPDRARTGATDSQQLKRSTRVAGVLASRVGSSWWPSFLTTEASNHFGSDTDTAIPALTYGDARYTDIVSDSTIDLGFKQSAITKLLNGTVPVFMWSQASLGSTDFSVVNDSPSLTNTLTNRSDQWHSQLLFSQVLSLDSPFHTSESEFLVSSSVATGQFETGTLPSLDVSESPVKDRKLQWLLARIASSNQSAPTIQYAPSDIVLREDRAILPPITPHVQGTPPFSFSIDLAPPLGVTLNQSTGQFTGTPTSPSTSRPYEVTVVGAFGTATDLITITVEPVSPSDFRYSPDTVSYIVGVAISPLLPVITGQVDGYSIDQAPPSGVIFSPDNGRFSGSPLVSFGPETLNVTASNITGSIAAPITLTVVDEDPSSPAYPSSDYNLEVGIFLAPQVPSPASGIADLWGITPTLPDGLGFSTANGEFSGTPTSPTVDDTYTVTATNTQTGGSDTVDITIEVVAPTTPPSGLGYPGNYFALRVGVDIGLINPTVTGVVTLYEASPLLPSGIDLDDMTGAISGNPATEGPSTHRITASNDAGITTADIGIVTAPELPKQVLPNFTQLGYVPTADFGGAVTSYGQFNAWIPPVSFTGGAYPVLITNESLGFQPSNAEPVLDSVANTLEYLAFQAGVLVISVDLPGNSTQFTGSGCFRDPESVIEGPQYSDLTQGHHFPERYFAFAVQYVQQLISTNTLNADPNNIVVAGTGSGAAIAAWVALGIDRAYPTGTSRIQQTTKVKGIIASRPLISYTAIDSNIGPQPLDVGRWASPEGGVTNSTNLGSISTERKERASVAHYILDSASFASSTAALILADTSLTSSNFVIGANGYPALSEKLLGSPEDLWHAYMLKRMLDTKEPTFHGVHTHLAVDETVAAGFGEDVTFSGGVDGFEAQSLALQWLLNLYSDTLSGSESPPIDLTYTPAGPYSFPVFTFISALNPSNNGSTIISYSVSPPLPSGLDLNIFSGGITGYPDSPTPIADYRVTGVNSGGTDFIDLSITVLSPVGTSPTNLTYFPPPPYVFTQNSPIPTLVPSYDGGEPTVTFSSNPTLPIGLSIDGPTGLISGRPLVEIEPSVNYTITVQNDTGSTTEVLPIEVVADAGGPPPGPIWGTHVQGASYFSRSIQFNDFMKRGFLWARQGSPKVIVDELPDGVLGARYPDPSNVEGGIAFTFLFADSQGGIPSGTARLYWSGGFADSVRLTGNIAGAVVDSGISSPWFFRDYNFDGSLEGAVNVEINSNNVLDPVRDMHLWNPDVVAPASPAAIQPPIFSANWDSKFAISQNGAGYPPLTRVMNWGVVNRYGRVVSANNPPPPVEITVDGPWVSPTMYTWSRDEGVPYEVAVALANRWNSVPWFCIVHRGRGDGTNVLNSPDYIKYVEKTAGIILNGRVDASGVQWAGLDSNREYVIEWANETWNTGFPVTNWLLNNGATATERATVQAREMEMVYTAFENVATPTQRSNLKFFLGGTNANALHLSNVYQELSPDFQANVLTAGGPPGYWLPSSTKTGTGPTGYLFNTGSPNSPVFPNLPVDAAQVIADAEEDFPTLYNKMNQQASFMQSVGKEFWIYEHNYGVTPTGPLGVPPDGWVGLAWQSHAHPDLFDAQRRAMQTLFLDTGAVRLCLFSGDAFKVEDNRDGHWGVFENMTELISPVPVSPANYIHTGFPKWAAHLAGSEGLDLTQWTIRTGG
jgi:hypothetical protein